MVIFKYGLSVTDAGAMTQFSCRRESFLTTSSSLKIDSCLESTERFSRRIVRFIRSAIDLIHSERVSTSTSSLFAYRLANSSHASMMMPKFWCHEYETGFVYFGLCFKDLSVKYYVLYGDHLSLYGHMVCAEILNRSNCKVGHPGEDLESRVAAKLLCSWRFWKQQNGYSYRKCMVTRCIERTEGCYYGRTYDSKCC